jgi:CheY-like chemotaxis protein
VQAIFRERRIVTRCRVEYSRLGERVAAESEDLSPRGVFVRCDLPLPVGAVVELTITLPGDSDFRVVSRVRHLLNPKAAKALGRLPGMGFEFLEHENEGRDRLILYLRELHRESASARSGLSDGAYVLVADSSTPLLGRLQNALGESGFEVIVCANGAEAYASCLERAPDVLLTASKMHVSDGWALLKMLADKPFLANIPVVMMSEDSSDISRLQAYRLGVRDFIPKPFTDEELVIRLRRIAVEARFERDAAVLRGTLGEISLATLLSLLDFERKSGILVVRLEDNVARMFVAGGRVVKVEGPHDKLSSRDRILYLLDWTDGTFEFTACEVVGEDDIGLQTQHLLLEHARTRDQDDDDEWSRDSEIDGG